MTVGRRVTSDTISGILLSFPGKEDRYGSVLESFS
jgi:hypothetical protein